MSATQNLVYSVVQVAHNFGALAAVGGSFAATKFHSIETRTKLAKLVLAGWATQAISGGAFGATSYYFYHRLPDIAGIAVLALYLKITCAVLGFGLLAVYLLRNDSWQEESRRKAWLASTMLGMTALTAAAFLRWFS